MNCVFLEVFLRFHRRTWHVFICLRNASLCITCPCSRAHHSIIAGGVTLDSISTDAKIEKMSTVFVHVGQCGNQVSQSLWKCFEKDGSAAERYWRLLRLLRWAKVEIKALILTADLVDSIPQFGNYVMKTFWISDRAGHFSNLCNIYKVEKMIHGKRSDNHCNRSDTQLTITNRSDTRLSVLLLELCY